MPGPGVGVRGTAAPLGFWMLGLCHSCGKAHYFYITNNGEKSEAEKMMRRNHQLTALAALLG